MILDLLYIFVKLNVGLFQLENMADEDQQQANASTSNKDPEENENVTVTEILWNYFTKLENNQAQCKACPSIIKTTNISGVQRHLESKHPTIFKEFSTKKAEVLTKKKKKSKSKSGMAPPRDKKQPPLSFTPVVDPELQKRWDDALVDYIGDSYVSFSQVSKPSFQKLIKVANKKIKVKTRKTLSNHVEKKSKQILSQIVKVLKESCPDLVSVSFTTDMWTSREGDAFISLTIHYIDK